MEHHPKRRILIVGGSRGIGAVAAAHLAARGHDLLCVSRTPSLHGTWVAADVTTDDGLDRVVVAVGTRPLDALLYLGGTWENGAFTDAYRFVASPREETRRVIEVNLVAPILLTQMLLPALSLGTNPRVLLMGALSGRDGSATPEVANTASKFGLRGAAQAMALSLRPHAVGVTVINPGNVATPEVLDDIAAGRSSPQRPIPMSDLLATLELVLALSSATVPAEIDLTQADSGA